MGFIIFIAVSIVALIVSACIKTSKETKKGKELFQKYIDSHDINVTKELDFSTSLTDVSKFIIDDENETVNLLSYTFNKPENIRVNQFEYKDVVRCEIIRHYEEELVEEEDSSLLETLQEFVDEDSDDDDISRNRSIMKRKRYITKLGFRVIFNDLSFPHLEILFRNSKTEDSNILRCEKDLLDDWVSTMNIIIERGRYQR